MPDLTMLTTAYTSDYFAYLEAPENASRFTVTADQLARLHPDGAFHVLDLGCGTAPLRGLLSPRCRYTGVDHDGAALARARRRHGDVELVEDDNVAFCQRQAEAGRRWDAVVLAGVLFHNVAAVGDADHHDDVAFLRVCRSITAPGGHAALVTPFAFTMGSRSFWEQARWKHDAVTTLLHEAWPDRPPVVHQSITKQIGLAARIAEQTERPRWFSDADEEAEDRFCGHEMACLATIVRMQP